MLTPAVHRESSQFVRLEPAAQGREILRALFGLDAAALAAVFVEMGEPAYRGRQLAEAIYRQRLTEISLISTLPLELRRRLDESGWQVGRPRIAQIFKSIDGTERYLVDCDEESAQTVETVWMPEGDGGETGEEAEQDEGAPSFRSSSGDRVGEQESSTTRIKETWSRATICVSSQVGCAVNCQFCLTAKLGLQRNLTAGEIAGQVVSVLDRHAVEVGRDRVNLVFMGMGEPFLNYANFMAAVKLLVEEVGLSPQRMTVSTSGIVPGIEQFAQEPPTLRPHLAISLNAPNDEVRAAIMPINRKWNIDAVIAAVRKIRLRPRERVTFEYVLLSGVTDRPEHASEVARLVRRTGLPAKVNLIAWNPGPGIPYTMPSPAAVEDFRQRLVAEGIPAYLRQPRGRDIFAACGQLKRTVEG
ncbi:MAG: 23S rRNA (adenine(2503)-C(2))-methyltransferase RlmN [Terracidiphilus sp.]